MNKYLGIKQKPGSSNCLAIVAAMAFNCSPDEFEEYWGWEPPYHATQFIVFGITKGYMAGFSIRLDEPMGLSDDINSIILTVPFMERGLPFHAAVVSETNPTIEHAIYFDGKQIYDPNPAVPDGRPLTDYKIVELQFIEGPDGWFSEDLKKQIIAKVKP